MLCGGALEIGPDLDCSWPPSNQLCQLWAFTATPVYIQVPLGECTALPFSADSRRCIVEKRGVCMFSGLSAPCSLLRTSLLDMRWSLCWKLSMGPSLPPRQPFRFTCWVMVTGQGYCLPMAATATCLRSGRCPPLTACLTAAAKA